MSSRGSGKNSDTGRGPAGTKPDGKVRTAERKARLARALRDNLRRRKEQARSRKAKEDEK